MPKVIEPEDNQDNDVEESIPSTLRPFFWHGISLEYRDSGRNAQAVGECPFCGKLKLYVAIENSKWECKVCGVSGNVNSFLKQLWQASLEQTPDGAYESLAEERGILSPRVLALYGACKSIITDEWLIPGFNGKRALNQLYRRIKIKDKAGRWNWKWLPTPDLDASKERHGLCGLQPELWGAEKPDVIVCEGFFDAVMLYETLSQAKINSDGELVRTGNERMSLTADTNVIAVPGANVFPETWAPLLAGKNVYLAYDSDHPFESKAGNEVQGAGLAGMKRVCEILSVVDEKPLSIKYLKWGSKTQHDPKHPTGYDVSDYLREWSSISERVKAYDKLREKFEVVPDLWLPGRSPESIAQGELRIEPLPCRRWGEVLEAWNKAFEWTTGHERALTSMLATALSTETIGEPVWMLVLSPPSTGKTSMCEAMHVANKYVKSVSNFTGFHSGYKEDKEGAIDHSLLPKIRNKTLIIKDGDTLLKNPARDHILAEMRDLFDRSSRTHYKHGINRDYDDYRFTILIAGTAAMKELDTAELGGRFITVSIMDEIDTSLERNVSRRTMHRAFRTAAMVANGKVESRHDPHMLKAKQLTAGYLIYLREHAEELLDSFTYDESHGEKIMDYGEFVAMIRARPPKKQDEIVERELSARLVEQFTRLATCLTIVLGKQKLDDDVVSQVRQIALDTGRGTTLTICGHLYNAYDIGVEPRRLAVWISKSEDATRNFLRFLKRIKVVEPFESSTGWRWRLTERMKHLYKTVVLNEE